MSKRFLVTLLTFVVVIVGTGIAVFLVKGYTFSPTEKKVSGTGIITITSEPDSASVYIDGHLTTATNATIPTLPPKLYAVKVIKEGFIPWEKTLEVKEGIVTPLKVTLFPSIPTIYPLTFNGISSPIISPDGSKVAFLVKNGKKPGVWVWTLLRNQPISFARSAEPHQIADNNPIDYSKAVLKFSPDSKNVLATIGNNNYLLDSDNFNNDPRDITPILQSTQKGWDEDIKDKEASRVLAVKDLSIRNIASNSGVLKWSPDETKFIYRSSPLSPIEKKGEDVVGLKVYDLEEKKDYQLPPAKIHTWLPDSRHIILIEDSKISVVDFDGTNKAVIFAGSFLDNFVFAWPDSSRLVIISSVPTPTASEPNLFGINLK